MHTPNICKQPPARRKTGATAQDRSAVVEWPGAISGRLFSALSLITLIVAGGISTAAHAAIPAAALADPRYLLGYLDVTHYGATPNNAADDDTASIQAALEDAYQDNLVAFFPTGTYHITNTLRCRKWRPVVSATSTTNPCDPDGPPIVTLHLATNPFRLKAYVLVGEHGGARPVIKVKDNATDFSDPANPRPLLMLRLYSSQQLQNEPETDPMIVLAAPNGWNIDTPATFNCELRNIDFDCSGKVGAIGVAWPGAQGCLVNDVKVTATGAHAGFYGLAGRHWGAINVEVVGGQYGIRSGYGPDGGATGAGSMIVGARLINQTIHAIDYLDFVPLVMTGFHIEKDFAVSGATGDSPVPVIDSPNTANNTLTLLDGRIELKNVGATINRVAIKNPNSGTGGKNLYIRNVHIKGTTALVQSPGGLGLNAGTSTQWHRIDEYSYNDLRGPTGGFPSERAPCSPPITDRAFATRSLIDGTISSTAQPAALFTANIQPPSDIVSRHLPAGGFPYYEGSGSPAAIVVTAAPYNAIPGDGIDDTAAIQQAIDDASGPGFQTYGGRVFIPKFKTGSVAERAGFEIRGTPTTPALTLRAGTKLFGAGKTGMAKLAASHSGQPITQAEIIIQTVDDPVATTYLGNLELDVPASNLYEKPFVYLDWKAGPGSSTFALSLQNSMFKDPDPVGVPFIYTRFTGNAGGRHYFYPFTEIFSVPSSFLADSSNTLASYRATVIDGTDWPLWFYGFNVEASKRDHRTTDVEIKNASNIAMLGWKREGGAPMLQIANSSNIALFGAGSMREKPSARVLPPGSLVGYVETSGTSDKLLMANLLVQSIPDGVDGYTLKEALSGGSPVQVAYPLGVSLYRRGAIDYEAMYPGTVVKVLPSIHADDGYVLATGALSSTGTGTQALRIGDDAGNQQYRSIVSFDTTGIPTGSTVMRATILLKCGLIIGSIPSSFATQIKADIKSGFFGTGAALQAGDFSASVSGVGVASLPIPATDAYTSDELAASALPFITPAAGKVQLRLYFDNPTNNDSGADYLGFHGGGDPNPANFPYLQVVYRTP